jgi:hypothetical protein
MNTAEVLQYADGNWYVIVNGTRIEFGADEARARAFASLAAGTATAMAEWAQKSREVLRLAEQIVLQGQALKLLYDDNDLYTLVSSAASGTAVPGSNMIRERAIAIGSLMQDLERWLAEPAVGDPELPGLPSRRRIIMQRD